MRILFMGTPDFALASLEELYNEKFDIAGVFTQPDKPRGRGMELVPSPVKVFAEEKGIPVYQPSKLKDGEAFKIIKDISPDILVVVAYGKIIPDDILAIPEFGAVNVHGSLLPKYRGAAPIQWSVLNGDSVTGVTTMYLAHDMDAGDIIYSESTEIGEFETSGELFDRLKVMGAGLLVKTLKSIENGDAPRTPQNHEEATYVSMLDKSISPIDFSRTRREVIKHIYGLQPWPVATWNGLKVFSADYSEGRGTPGEVLSTDRGIEIACSDGSVIITEVQAPGKKRMNSLDYLRGHKL